MSAYKFLRECLCKFPSLEVIELEEISKEVKEEITQHHGGKEKMLATQRSREEQKREVTEVRVYKMLSEIITNCPPSDVTLTPTLSCSLTGTVSEGPLWTRVFPSHPFRYGGSWWETEQVEEPPGEVCHPCRHGGSW